MTTTYTMNNYAVEFYTLTAAGYDGSVVAQVVTKTLGVVVAEAVGPTQDEALTALADVIWMMNCQCGRQIIEQRTSRDPEPMCCECQARTKKAVVQARVHRTEPAKPQGDRRVWTSRTPTESKAISFEQAKAMLEVVS